MAEAPTPVPEPTPEARGHLQPTPGEVPEAGTPDHGAADGEAVNGPEAPMGQPEPEVVEAEIVEDDQPGGNHQHGSEHQHPTDPRLIELGTLAVRLLADQAVTGRVHGQQIGALAEAASRQGTALAGLAEATSRQGEAIGSLAEEVQRQGEAEAQRAARQERRDQAVADALAAVADAHERQAQAADQRHQDTLAALDAVRQTVADTAARAPAPPERPQRVGAGEARPAAPRLARSVAELGVDPDIISTMTEHDAQVADWFVVACNVVAYSRSTRPDTLAADLNAAFPGTEPKISAENAWDVMREMARHGLLGNYDMTTGEERPSAIVDGRLLSEVPYSGTAEQPGLLQIIQGRGLQVERRGSPTVIWDRMPLVQAGGRMPIVTLGDGIGEFNRTVAEIIATGLTPEYLEFDQAAADAAQANRDAMAAVRGETRRTVGTASRAAAATIEETNNRGPFVASSTARSISHGEGAVEITDAELATIGREYAAWLDGQARGGRSRRPAADTHPVRLTDEQAIQIVRKAKTKPFRAFVGSITRPMERGMAAGAAVGDYLGSANIANSTAHTIKRSARRHGPIRRRAASAAERGRATGAAAGNYLRTSSANMAHSVARRARGAARRTGQVRRAAVARVRSRGAPRP